MAVTNSLAKQKQNVGLTAYLTQDAVKAQINKVIGGKNGDRFISAVVSSVQTTPALQECTNASILNAALLGQSLGLAHSPQLGQYYMVPFKNTKKGCKEAQFQLGYKGYIQLASRSGYYKRINALAIKEGELIRYNQLEEDIEVELIENDLIREETPTVGYYAMFEYANGFKKTMYWSLRKMQAHADKYSAAFSLKAMQQIENNEIPEKDLWKFSSFWYKDFDGMALKTMLRQLISKWGMISIDMQAAMESDADFNADKNYVEVESNVVEAKEVKQEIEDKQEVKQEETTEEDFFN